MAVVHVSAAPVSMTDAQKFVFDLKSWLLLPGVLEPALIAQRRQIYIGNRCG